MAFNSGADNLVAGDTNGLYDVFLYDRQTATTTRVSAAPGGANGNHASFFPAISADGARVAFVSFASNLVANDTNGAMDAFVYDRPTGTTTRVGAAAQANVPYYPPAISGDGRWVAYQFDDVFVYDMLTGTTRTASLRSDGTAASLSKQFPTISGDGRLVAFDTDADLTGFDFLFLTDVFVHDQLTGRTDVGDGGYWRHLPKTECRWPMDRLRLRESQPRSRRRK